MSGPGEERDERRHGYSFRRHLRRVVDEKGLRHVLLSLGGTALVLSGAFAYCRSSDITGPRVGDGPKPPSARMSTAPGPSAPKLAVSVFPTDLLPKFDPCDPTTTFSEMSGQDDITYTTEREYDADGQPTGEHKVRMWHDQKQQGRDNKGGEWHGSKKEENPEGGWTMRPGNSGNVIVHNDMCHSVTHSGPKEPSGSCNRGFKSRATHTVVLVEDPLTREGTLLVTTTALESSCPIAPIAMREPSVGRRRVTG